MTPLYIPLKRDGKIYHEGKEVIANGLYCGTAGKLEVITTDGNSMTLKVGRAGDILPIKARGILKGTTCRKVVALFYMAPEVPRKKSLLERLMFWKD